MDRSRFSALHPVTTNRQLSVQSTNLSEGSRISTQNNGLVQAENRVSGRRRQRRGSSPSTSCSSVESNSSSCCCSRTCNSQICCSYIIATMSSFLVVGGVYLAVLKWNYMWLTFSAFGLVLIFFGTCLHYCGSQALANKWRSSNDSGDEFDAGDFDVEGDRHRIPARNQRKRGRNEVAGVPPSRSLSQLSLNMIPQYFAPSDTLGQLVGSSASRTNTMMTSTSRGSELAATPAVPSGQIFSVNGQSFLILPLANESTQATSTESGQCIPLDSLVVKIPSGDNENRKQTVTEFLANFDPKTYNQFMSKSPSVQTQASSQQPKCSSEDTGIQTGEDSSIVSLPSPSSFAIECRQSNLEDRITQRKQSFDVPDRTAINITSGDQPHSTKVTPQQPQHSIRFPTKPSSQIEPSVPSKRSHQPVDLREIPPVIPAPGSSSTTFFISCPSTSRGNESGSSSNVRHQSLQHKTVLHSQDNITSSASVRRKETFSKTRLDALTFMKSAANDSSTDSSPEELLPSSSHHHRGRYSVDAEAAAERSHAHFVSSGRRDRESEDLLLQDEPELDESEFLSPPPSYAEVMESDYDSPEDERQFLQR